MRLKARALAGIGLLPSLAGGSVGGGICSVMEHCNTALAGRAQLEAAGNIQLLVFNTCIKSTRKPAQVY
jgi:hypothetical protein